MKKSLKHKIGGIGCSLLLLTPVFTPTIINAEAGYADGFGYGWDDTTDLTDDMAQDNMQAQQADTVQDSIEMENTMNENMVEANEFQSALETSEAIQQEMETLQDSMNDSSQVISTEANNPDVAADALLDSSSTTEALETANQENTDNAQSKADDNQQKCKKDLDSLGTRILNAINASSASEAWANLNGEELSKSDKEKQGNSMAYLLTDLFGVSQDWMNNRSILFSPSYDEDGKRIKENYSDDGKTYLGGSNIAQALTETDLASFVLDLSGSDRYKSRDEMNNIEKAIRYGDNVVSFVANLAGKGEVDSETSKIGYLLRGYSLADYYNDRKSGDYTHDSLNGGGKSNSTDSDGDGDASD